MAHSSGTQTKPHQNYTSMQANFEIISQNLSEHKKAPYDKAWV